MENCSESNSPRVEFSKTALITVNTVYMITALSALIGNCIVIKIYSNGNYPNKLKVFFINLAIADILNAVLCIPFTYTEMIYGQWIYPLIMCPIAQFIQYLCIFVSAFTLTTISIERFAAILNPLSKVNRFISSHSKHILFIIWLSGASYSGIGTESTIAVPKSWSNNTYYTCEQHVRQYPDISKVFSIINFSLTYALPLVIMFVLYTILIKKLIRIMSTTLVSCSENSFNVSNGKECQLRRNSVTFSKTKCIKMLIVVVISFMVCMTPVKVRQVIYWIEPAIFLPLYCLNPVLNIWMKLVFNWLFSVHSAVNPIIYSFLSENFQRHFLLDYQILKNKFRFVHFRSSE